VVPRALRFCRAALAALPQGDGRLGRFHVASLLINACGPEPVELGLESSIPWLA
jgi:hypothetical protein